MPFHYELVWPAAAVTVVFGEEEEVRFVDLESGTVRARVPVSGDWGHLAIHHASETGEETLFVLGQCDVLAFRASLDLRWRADGVAVDGILFKEVHGNSVRISAEMDPPGGWFAVALDLQTGAEISRIPAFTPDYVGVYRR